MKKFISIVLMLLLMIAFLVACSETQEPKLDNGSSELCEHNWELSEFVTEDTDVPFAGVFVCKQCEKKTIRSIAYTDIDIPLISVTGDLGSVYENEKGLSKEIKVVADFSYQSKDYCLNSFASFTYQGKSTKDDPKKNYSVNILDSNADKKQKVTFDESWGAGSKYALKANYIDPIGVRDISLATLYGQISHSAESDDPFSSLVNGGAVDGYPVLFYLNGKYQGLYTWNIRKDKWLYGMDSDDAGEAVICGSAVDELKNDEGITIPLDEGMRTSKSWEYEYVNENYGEDGWALASFNSMLYAVKHADQGALRAVIEEYTILDRLLDVVLFNVIFGMADNISGNQVWCTYDGKKWTPVPYDLDRTLGRDGEPLIEADIPLTDCLPENVLYTLIFQAYYEDIKSRYSQLRENILTTENVLSILEDKLRGVDDRYFAAEEKKWPDADWRKSENAEDITGIRAELDYIEDYLNKRFAYCDAFFAENDAASIIATLTVDPDIA